MMSPLISLLFVVLGTLIQGTAVVLSRKYGVAFLALIPIIVVHQYFFLSAYTKSENFTLIWFLAVALTSMMALGIGHLVFSDAFTWKDGLGIFLILAGVVLTKI